MRRVWVNFTDDVHNTIDVNLKQGCSISPTLFGLYINELEDIIHESLGNTNGRILFGVTIVIILFADDIILFFTRLQVSIGNLMFSELFVEIISYKLQLNLGK